MRTITSIDEMQRIADGRRSGRGTVGVVPTMGYLHDGHASLIRRAKEITDFVIVTIFVNPAQFGPNEDFNRYPRDIKRDTELALGHGADILFVPGAGEIYPPGYSTSVEVERLSGKLEGKARPGHFKGVATVVAKLFNITKPNIAVFGQKDAQQVVIIRRMVKDLNFNIEIVVNPTVREADGLALSSRNVYLSAQERSESPVIYASLRQAEAQIRGGTKDPLTIKENMTKLISERKSAAIEYISIADTETLDELGTLNQGGSVLISLAVRFGNTRLIDNLLMII